MSKTIYLTSLAIAAVLLLVTAGPTCAETFQVITDKAIKPGMNVPVILRVVGSVAQCNYLSYLTELKPGTPEALWVLKADRRSCLKSPRGDIEITDVKALVLLENFPVAPKTNLSLHVRPGK
jgi:hypothetical protein